MFRLFGLGCFNKTKFSLCPRTTHEKTGWPMWPLEIAVPLSCLLSACVYLSHWGEVYGKGVLHKTGGPRKAKHSFSLSCMKCLASHVGFFHVVFWATLERFGHQCHKLVELDLIRTWTVTWCFKITSKLLEISNINKQNNFLSHAIKTRNNFEIKI